MLYVRGELLPEDHFAVAIVGTRKVTPYGRQVTEELSAFLAANGVTGISGLARGVDAVAHSAAIKSGGGTIADFRVRRGSNLTAGESHISRANDDVAVR